MLIFGVHVKCLYLLQVFFDAEGKFFKPVIIHDKNLSRATRAMFEMGLTFKETYDGDLDKAAFDFLLDTLASSVSYQLPKFLICTQSILIPIQK